MDTTLQRKEGGSILKRSVLTLGVLALIGVLIYVAVIGLVVVAGAVLAVVVIFFIARAMVSRRRHQSAVSNSGARTLE